MNSFLDFRGKHVLVDGAGMGMGRETAIQLSKLGAKVTLIDLDTNALQETLDLMQGEGHLSMACNLGELEMIEGIVKDLVAKNGAVDGYVHCVGLRCKRPLKMITPEIWQSVFKVNFGSFMEIMRHITHKGCFNPGLSIVAISSMSAKTGGSGISVYSSSKAAIDGAIRSLAQELAPKKIRINSVMPGQINTPAYAQYLATVGGVDKVMERQYLGLGEAEDVVNMILFLLSERSRMITGAAIPIDGGYMTA